MKEPSNQAWKLAHEKSVAIIKIVLNESEQWRDYYWKYENDKTHRESYSSRASAIRQVLNVLEGNAPKARSRQKTHKSKDQVNPLK